MSAEVGCHLEDLEPNKESMAAPEVIQVGTGVLLPGSPKKTHYDNDDSSAVSTVSIGEMCKICHCGGEANVSLIAPCYCSGSLKYVHQECLQRWIKSSDIKRCELCKYPFAMQAKVKPFCQWEKLDMTALERRKLFCSVTFHVVAITCVVWSLYVLIDRTAEEIRNGELQWPFWTKLVVVAIGFTGGLVFMYIQCKVYVHLCRKWKAYNRIIVVQDAPEGIHKPSEGKFSKLSTSNAIVEANNLSRRSSSAPNASSHVGPSSASVGQNTTEKTNAETQTALRGVAILEGECGHTHHSACSHAHRSDSTPRLHEEAIFFTECECSQQRRSSRASAKLSSSSSAKGRGLQKTQQSYKHSASTPNVAVSASRSSRRDRSEVIRSHSRDERARSSVQRKFSLSPARNRADLPGSPDPIEEGSNTSAIRTSTVVSPIRVKK